jgi:hypothetical protein
MAVTWLVHRFVLNTIGDHVTLLASRLLARGSWPHSRATTGAIRGQFSLIVATVAGTFANCGWGYLRLSLPACLTLISSCKGLAALRPIPAKTAGRGAVRMKLSP